MSRQKSEKGDRQHSARHRWHKPRVHGENDIREDSSLYIANSHTAHGLASEVSHRWSVIKEAEGATEVSVSLDFQHSAVEKLRKA